MCAVCLRVWLPYEDDVATCSNCQGAVHSTCDNKAAEHIKVGLGPYTTDTASGLGGMV